MNEIDISKKYKPLFRLLTSDLQEIDTVIMTGGRASGKSFVVSLFTLIALVEHEWNVLYTRYTNMSIVDSIKPEVSDKIELLNYESKVNDTQKQIEKGNNRIAFKGIKTGSKIQTANLKSLSGFNCFVVDEAEELPDYETFKKVFYSIRSVEKRNLTILILNPTTKEHWIFKEFFEKKGLEGGENTVIDNVMYIHTSYKDVNKKYIPKNIIRDYNKLLIEDTLKYDNIVIGGWIQDPEGVLIPKSVIKLQKLDLKPDEIDFSFAVTDPADKGGDKYSIPFIQVIQYNNDIAFYVNDVIHNKDGTMVNCERVPLKVSENNTQQIWVESNGIGLASVLLLKKHLSNHTILTAFPSTVNKEIRILSNYEFIIKYFIFNESKYNENKEYKDFVNDLTSYSKEGDNTHKKDAIDVLSTAAQILKIKYKSILFN